MKKNYKEIMYSAFKAICSMEIEDSKKSGMLTILFSMEPNNWRVVGISTDAIKVFHENDYLRKSKMGINRSHIKRRIDSHKEIMKKEAQGAFKNHEDWWSFYFENDKTYIQTSSENMKKNNHSKIIEISNPDYTLFKAKGFAWQHGENEIELLKKLYQEHCSS
jgi:hypothetical protein